MVATKGETGRGYKVSKTFLCSVWENVMNAEMLEVSLLRVGTVLRLERDAWSMVKMSKASNKGVPPPSADRTAW